MTNNLQPNQAPSNQQTDEYQPRLFSQEDVLNPFYAIKFRLVEAYAAQLLSDPPIASVALDNAHRAANAKKFAAKDINRVYNALETAGLVITEQSVHTYSPCAGCGQGKRASREMAMLGEYPYCAACLVGLIQGMATEIARREGNG